MRGVIKILKEESLKQGLSASYDLNQSSRFCQEIDLERRNRTSY